MPNTTSEEFINQLISGCKNNPRSLVLVEGEDPRVLEAASRLLSSGAAERVYLVGCPDRAKAQADRQPDLEIFQTDKFHWLTADDSTLNQMCRDNLESYLTGKDKTYTPDQKVQWCRHPANRAAVWLNAGKTEAALGGCVFATGEIIRAAIQAVGLRPGINTVSSSFALLGGYTELAPKLVFGDCGVVVSPNSQQLIDIAEETIRTFEQLFPTLEPIVGFLSFSTKGSAQHPEVDKVKEAYQGFTQKHRHIKADGELQLDSALIPQVSRQKCPDSPVEGQANCLIFPDLNSGNIAYKLAQRLAGYQAYGPILQGLAKPFSDLSRGASSQDIFVSSLIAMLRADG